MDKEIIATVKKEMAKPRLTESVRNALEADAALALLVLDADPARA
jgi:hypothetical protein